MDRRHYRPGDQPIRGYTLVRLLGRGGFGEVWSAQGPGVDVALKIIFDLRRNVGGKELRALQILRTASHPSLISLHGYWCIDSFGQEIPLDSIRLSDSIQETLAVTPESLIIAMDLAECNLHDLLDKYPQGLPVHELMPYFQDIARGIDYLNRERRIQHCDIKPQNIFIRSGSAQVGDFSLAKLVDEIRTSSLSMSPAYSAPEISDEQGPSETSDQYSLAISYVELRTGRLPYEAETISAVNRAKRSGKLLLDSLTPSERTIIQRATHLNPKLRFASCIDFVAALDQAVRGGPKQVAAPRGIVGWQSGAVVTLLLGSLGFAYYQWRSSQWLSAEIAFEHEIDDLLDQQQFVVALDKLASADFRSQQFQQFVNSRQNKIRDDWSESIQSRIHVNAVNQDTGGDAEGLASSFLSSHDEVALFGRYMGEGPQLQSLRGLLQGNQDALRSSLPQQIEHALARLDADPADAQRTAQTWWENAQQIDAPNDVKLPQEIFQLKLITFWAELRQQGINQNDLGERLQQLTLEAESVHYPMPPQLMAVWDLCFKLNSTAVNDSTIDAIDGLLLQTDGLIWSPEPTSWEPRDPERQHLLAAVQGVAEKMLSFLQGPVKSPERYVGYDSFLRKNLTDSEDAKIVVTMARLNVIRQRYDLADRILQDGNDHQAEHASEFAALRAITSGDLASLQPIPDFVKLLPDKQFGLDMQRAAASRALEHALKDEKALPLNLKLQALTIAEALIARLPAGASEDLQAEYETARVQLRQARRDWLVANAFIDKPDFPALQQACRAAEVDSTAPMLLQYIRIECDLETGKAVNQVPQVNLEDGHAAYAYYVQVIDPHVSDVRRIELVEQLGFLEEPALLALGAHRRQSLANLLVRAAESVVSQPPPVFSAELPWPQPFANANVATQAHRYLHRAEQLGCQLTPNQRILRGVAAWMSHDARAHETILPLLASEELATNPFREQLIYAAAEWLTTATASSATMEHVHSVAGPLAEMAFACPSKAGRRLLLDMTYRLAKQIDAASDDFQRTNMEHRIALSHVAITASDLPLAQRFVEATTDKHGDALQLKNLLQQVSQGSPLDVEKTMQGWATRWKELPDLESNLVAPLQRIIVQRLAEQIRALKSDPLSPLRDQQLAMAKRIMAQLPSDELPDLRVAFSNMEAELLDDRRSRLKELAFVERPDFDHILPYCHSAAIDANAPPLLQFIQTECQWEAGDTDFPLPPTTLDSEHRTFGLYLQLLEAARESEIKEPVFMAITQATTESLQRLGAYRLEKLRDALLAGAVKLTVSEPVREPAQGADDQLWPRPYSEPADASLALSLLNRAASLDARFELHHKVLRAAAAWQTSDPDAWQFTEQLLPFEQIDNSPYRDYLVDSLGTAVGTSQERPSAQVLQGSVGPFAKLVMSKPNAARRAERMDHAVRLIRQVVDLPQGLAQLPDGDLQATTQMAIAHGQFELAQQILAEFNAADREVLLLRTCVVSLLNNQPQEVESNLQQWMAANTLPEEAKAMVVVALRRAAAQRSIEEVQQLKSDPLSPRRDQLLELAQQLVAKLPDETNNLRTEIDRLRTELLSDRRTLLISQAFVEEPNFRQLSDYCKSAAIDANAPTLLQYIQTECDLELGRAAATLVSSSNTTERPIYAAYVEAIHPATHGDRQLELADTLSKATAAEIGKLGEVRRKRVAEMLLLTATKLVSTEEASPDSETPWRSPYVNAQLAERALRYYDRAESLGHTLDNRQQILAVAAAWQGKQERAFQDSLTLFATPTAEALPFYGHVLDATVRYLLNAEGGRLTAERAGRLVGPYARLAMHAPANEEQQASLARAYALLKSVNVPVDLLATGNQADLQAAGWVAIWHGNLTLAQSLLGSVKDKSQDVARLSTVITNILSDSLVAVEEDLDKWSEQSSLPIESQQLIAAPLRLAASQRIIEILRRKDDPLSAKADQYQAIAQRLLERLTEDDASVLRQELVTLNSELRADRHTLLQKLAFSDDPPFDRIQAGCRIASVDEDAPLVLQYIQAECDREREESSSPVPAIPLADEWRWYGEYVRGLAPASDKTMEASFAAKVVAAKPAELESLGQFRRQKIAAILVQAAQSMISTHRSVVTENGAWGPPCAESTVAAEVLRYLDQAIALGVSLPPSTDMLRLAVAWQVDDARAFTQSIDLFSQQPRVESPYQGYVLHATVQRIVKLDVSSTKTDYCKQLIGPYATSVQALSPPTDQQAVAFFTKILTPVIEMAKLAAPETPQDRFAVASALGQAGKLLRDNHDAEWPFQGLFERQLELFDKAIGLEPNQADYYYGRCAARMAMLGTQAMPPSDDDTPSNLILADAERALELNPRSAEAAFLLGRALVEQAHRESTIAAQARKIEQAIAKYDWALELQHPVPDLVRDGRGQAFLEMASLQFVLWQDRPVQRPVAHRMLQRAFADASQVLVETPNDGKHAMERIARHERMGNISEDLAWLVGIDPHVNFEFAIQHFTEALQHSSTATQKAGSYFHRGRCHAKMSQTLFASRVAPEIQNQKQASLTQAESDLSMAISLLGHGDGDPEPPDSYWRWLGNVLLEQERYDEAKEKYQRALAGKLIESDDRLTLQRIAEIEVRQRKWFDVDVSCLELVKSAGDDADSCEAMRIFWQSTWTEETLSLERFSKVASHLAAAKTGELSAATKHQLDLFTHHVCDAVLVKMELDVYSKDMEPWAAALEPLLDKADQQRLARCYYVRGYNAMREGLDRKDPQKFAQARDFASKALGADPTAKDRANWHALKGFSLMQFKDRAFVAEFAKAREAVRQGSAIDPSFEKLMKRIEEEQGTKSSPLPKPRAN